MLPFYLKMMGLNTLHNAADLWDDLVRVGRTARLNEVQQLLAPDHWRPVVMGAWFSLRFGPQDIGPALLDAIGRSRGSLTAPPLAVVTSFLVGADASAQLNAYIQRDLAMQHGSASFVAAVVESLDDSTVVACDDRDRTAFATMFGIARRLRAALCTE